MAHSRINQERESPGEAEGGGTKSEDLDGAHSADALEMFGRRQWRYATKDAAQAWVLSGAPDVRTLPR